MKKPIFKLLLVIITIFTSVGQIYAAETRTSINTEESQLLLNYNPNVDHEKIAEYLALVDLEYHQRTTSPIMLRSSYGAAWPYQYTASTTINCYGYAGNFPYALNPGDIAYYYGALEWGDSVDTVAGYVLQDMSRKYRVSSRIISSATATISSNEYRIALRTGSAL